MNDKEKLINLLKEMGVAYRVEGNSIVLEAGCAKVDAYVGFVAEFLFDDTGKFIKVMIGE